MSEANDDGYAIKLADDSYRWYHDRALACRRGYQIQETVTLIVAAAIPASAVLTHNDARIPAILGGLVVILAGLRPIFHWHENYLRFSGAREAVKTQRRLYEIGATPYDDPTTRDRELTQEITRREQEETAGWIKVAAERPKP